VKVYHKAKMVAPDGSVSPLCAGTPRALDLSKELWTLRDDAVTCKKCLAMLSRPIAKKGDD
jgi:hypothetical protein